MMGEVRDHLEKHDDALVKLQGEQWQGRQPAFIHDDYDGGIDTDDDQAIIVGLDINPKRQNQRGRFDNVDRNIGNIKMKIPPF
ncbi:unnamed protein product [Dovyalis caffra]|uniref:Transposase n=1 Tax=Dovyalis caffra TaxID=77055 RepID=A0AAV1R1M2_9ROSI|nr:unnamed protein product [Dovyalis caffra]